MPITTRRAKLRSLQRTDSEPSIDEEGYVSSALSDPDDNTASDLDWKDHRERVRGETAASSKGKSNPHKLELSQFPALPLDIVFEILALLTPTDLANLAQTNTAFRTTLTTPQASNIWKAARRRTGNAPDSPPSAGEVSWARFIYGPSKCQECGVSNVHHVDFALMRRVCKKCKSKKLVYAGFFTKRFPNFNAEMLELIPHTNTGCSSTVRSKEGSNFYWEDDIYAMATIYSKYQMDIGLRKPHAKEALQEYKDQRVAYVRAVTEHATICREWWSLEFAVYWHKEQAERVQKQYDVQVSYRFRELGYEDQDIKSIRTRQEAQKDRNITERVWKRVKPILQPCIETALCKRLETDQAPTINARKRLVKNAYDDYKRTLRPIEWIHLPPPALIYVMPAFFSLIYMNLDVPLEQTTCDEAARNLSEYISAFKDNLKERLLHAMADAGAFGKITRLSKSRVADSHGRLALATSVFASSGPVSLSFDEVTAKVAWTGTQSSQEYGSAYYIHMVAAKVWKSWDSTIRHDRESSANCASLIKALGLDPEATRPVHLDRLDRRFLCRQCSGEAQGGLAYTWRAFLSHCSTQHMWQSSFVRFTALNEEESAVVRQAEGADLAEQQEMWSCNHCAIHLDDLRTRPVVLQHVQEVHAIDEPEENADLFHAYPTVRRRPKPRRFTPRASNDEHAVPGILSGDAQQIVPTTVNE
ncbi:uncharacterized protein B0H18DRAFT_1016365 [Fomitopsis serialis]|uniref:uncharacterized protein n=1 Tax=Fomitopsis serialis TaxID=139415 RepID=UPI0020088DC2|nr:uncharacterized protein B0H18DRAFT_1016365 [Neoantrodia serialis]KAH9922960.1 hypothetical protein B0H18DRAFT_1016365 [Neoantrodia serialis]